MESMKDVVKALNNNINENKMAAYGGCKYLGVAANTGLQFTSFYVREDTTITVLSGVDANGATVNYLTTFAISGITLKAGDLYICPNGGVIKSMTITLGSVIGYM